MSQPKRSSGGQTRKATSKLYFVTNVFFLAGQTNTILVNFNPFSYSSDREFLLTLYIRLKCSLILYPRNVFYTLETQFYSRNVVYISET